MRTLIVGAAAIVLGTAGLVTTAAGVGAARPAVPITATRVTLTAATQHLTSSTGKHLLVSITAIQRQLTVRLMDRGAPESHTWTFTLPDSGFVYDDDGTGTLHTGAAVQPFGRMSLSITATGRSTTVGCGRTRATVTPVAVAGALVFKTHSTGANRWGSVSTSTARTFTGHSTVAVAIPADKLCQSLLPPCVTTTHWEAHNIANDLRGYTQLVGDATTVNGVSRSTLTGNRLTYLSSPANATRTDVTTIDVPAPALTTGTGTARIAVGPHQPDPTGSAQLSGSSEDQMPALACGAAGPNGPRTVRTDWAATYRNGTPRLTISQQIEGAFHLANVAGESNRANAGIERIVTTTGP
jgi:hypothetical protein